MRLVQEVAGESMQAVVDEVRALPEYAAKGEVSKIHTMLRCCSG